LFRRGSYYECAVVVFWMYFWMHYSKSYKCATLSIVSLASIPLKWSTVNFVLVHKTYRKRSIYICGLRPKVTEDIVWEFRELAIKSNRFATVYGTT